MAAEWSPEELQTVMYTPEVEAAIQEVTHYIYAY